MWKTDGTSAGTVLVKDINPGSGHATPRYLTNVNGTFYFNADNITNGRELWKSDGTSAGTLLVKDILPGPNFASPQYLTNVNGTLYFSANDDTHGQELWALTRNSSPNPVTNGPYSITIGKSLSLSAVGSSDVDVGDSIALYEWDVNGDGTYDVSTTGSTSIVTWSALQAAGIVAGKNNLVLKVTDTLGATQTAHSTLTLVINSLPFQPAASIPVTNPPFSAMVGISTVTASLIWLPRIAVRTTSASCWEMELVVSVRQQALP